MDWDVDAQCLQNENECDEHGNGFDDSWEWFRHWNHIDEVKDNTENNESDNQ